MRIEFINWAKIQHKKTNGNGKIIEKPTWFRMDNHIFFHNLWGELSDAEFRCFMFMLCQASITKNSGVFTYSEQMHTRMSGIEDQVFHSSVEKLRKLQVLRASGGRRVTAKAPSALLTRQDKTEHNTTLQNRLTADTSADTDLPHQEPELSTPELFTKDTLQHSGQRPKVAATKEKTLGTEIWEAFSLSYKARYDIDPIRNATTSTQCKNLGARLGRDAIQVVQFYLTHNGSFYLQKKHVIGLCLVDAESLHAQWQQGFATTQADVRRAEKSIDLRSRLDAIDRGEI